jgi:hypothetical protein
MSTFISYLGKNLESIRRWSFQMEDVGFVVFSQKQKIVCGGKYSPEHTWCKTRVAASVEGVAVGARIRLESSKMPAAVFETGFVEG